jgi:hypothetical protein
MKQTTTSSPHTVIFDRALTLEDLRRLPPETKTRLLLARLARIAAMDTVVQSYTIITDPMRNGPPY